MGFLDFFRPLKSTKHTRWQELGVYNARFVPFGKNMFNSDLVRACIRPLAEHSSKANAVCRNKPEIAKLLNVQPNMYMNGIDFLKKVRTILEVKNTSFIYIERDELGKVKGFYPVPYASYEAVEYNKRLYIQFYFEGSATYDLTLAWDDLAVLRKDYLNSDIAGEDNSPVLNRLELIDTAEQGIANAIKATANLRGILKSTKAMLNDPRLKDDRDRFVNDYINLENKSGIASLDATMEFIPVKMEPTMTSFDTQREFREDVYRYFGVNDNIIMSKFTEEEMEAFYDARIEPFLVALSTELTRKILTQRERDMGSKIIYESNRINFASTKTKLAMVQLVDRALMTPNEFRLLFNMAPYEGGDEFVMRLDTSKTGDDVNVDNGDLLDKE